MRQYAGRLDEEPETLKQTAVGKTDAMKRAGHLFEKIISFENLSKAADRAAKGKRDKVRIAEFIFRKEFEILELERQLAAGAYRPGAYHVFRVFEPKPRHICAAPFRDRVVHHAICSFLGPLFEKSFIFDFLCLPGAKGGAQGRETSREIL